MKKTDQYSNLISYIISQAVQFCTNHPGGNGFQLLQDLSEVVEVLVSWKFSDDKLLYLGMNNERMQISEKFMDVLLVDGIYFSINIFETLSGCPKIKMKQIDFDDIGISNHWSKYYISKEDYKDDGSKQEATGAAIS